MNPVTLSPLQCAAAVLIVLSGYVILYAYLRLDCRDAFVRGRAEGYRAGMRAVWHRLAEDRPTELKRARIAEVQRSFAPRDDA
jgi:hypothetical protein